MNITKQKTVADVVTENIKAAHIFKKYGIDFCCGGGITLEKACLKNEVDYTQLQKELEIVDDQVSAAYDYNRWDLSFLIDHIVNIHHTYVEENITLLKQYAGKVANVHGGNFNEVIEINRLFLEVANELTAHLKKEELILFPYIKKLAKAKKENTTPTPSHFGSVNNPIKMMENEHENAGSIFKTIATLSNNYTPPKEACNTFRALYAKLQEFEQDLHQHIHLENNILFPKAIQLEQQFSES